MKIVPVKQIEKEFSLEVDSLLIKESTRNQRKARIIAVGDIGFSGRIKNKSGNSDELRHIFNEVSPFIKTGDLVLANLETPIVEDSEEKLFASPSISVDVLSQAGFNILHLANNHMLDHGEEGLKKTILSLEKENIMTLGAGRDIDAARKLRVVKINGLRIGLLGCGHTNVNQKYDSWCYWEFDGDELIEAVKKSINQVDFLVLSIHTGLMYLDYPKPEMKVLVSKLFELGASLILMHHAHVLQSIEVNDDGKICCYNLGNFLFDTKEGNVEIPVMAKEQTESAVFVFDIDQGGICQAFVLPTYFNDDFIIHWATGDRGVEILNRLIRVSNDIKFDYSELFNKQRAQRNAMPLIKVMGFHIKKGNWKFVFSQLPHLRLKHIKMLISYFFTTLFGWNKNSDD